MPLMRYGKNIAPLEERAAPDLEREDGREVERERDLDEGADHVVERQLERREQVRTGEDIGVVLHADELRRTDVLHLVEAVSAHLEERQIGEDDEERDRQEAEEDDDARLLPIPAMLVERDIRSGLLRDHCVRLCGSHDGCSFLILPPMPEHPRFLPTQP